MSDKYNYEEIAHNIASICGFDEISYSNADNSSLVAYLREQFPETVKIEEDIPCVSTECEYFDIKMPENCGGECGGEPALCTCVKYLKSSKLITDFIQQREAGKPVEIKPNSQKTASVILSKCLEIFDGGMIDEIACIVSEFAEAYHQRKLAEGK